jgi:hypothetical protein
VGRKIEGFIQKLKLIIHDLKKLEKFVVENSCLPGPRANLELAFALSEVYENFGVLENWARIGVNQASVDDPRSFLPFCSAVCLGRLYGKTKDEKIVRVLKKLASDDRWRIREAAAFGFQKIGEDNFPGLKKIFSEWIGTANNREKRAMIVALAHPRILDRNTSLYCFKILEKVLENMERDDDFEILKKGLEFAVSVYTAANPEEGFSFMEKWIGKDEAIDLIIQSNLKKDRLLRKHPKKTEELLRMIRNS